MSEPLRSQVIEAIGYEIAIGCGHTLASVDPIKLGPNTRRIAESVLDAALSVLADHADEWVAHVAPNALLRDHVRELLVVLEGDR